MASCGLAPRAGQVHAGGRTVSRWPDLRRITGLYSSARFRGGWGFHFSPQRKSEWAEQALGEGPRPWRVVLPVQQGAVRWHGRILMASPPWLLEAWGEGLNCFGRTLKFVSWCHVSCIMMSCQLLREKAAWEKASQEKETIVSIP